MYTESNVKPIYTEHCLPQRDHIPNSQWHAIPFRSTAITHPSEIRDENLEAQPRSAETTTLQIRDRMQSNQPILFTKELPPVPCSGRPEHLSRPSVQISIPSVWCTEKGIKEYPNIETRPSQEPAQEPITMTMMKNNCFRSPMYSIFPPLFFSSLQFKQNDL